MKQLIAPKGIQEIVYSEDNMQETLVITDIEDGSRDLSLTVKVLGENSSVTVIGRMEGKNKDTKKWAISLRLQGKNQTGKLDLKGIANDSSNIEFDGGGIVANQSRNASIKVEERIYLFSSKAKARAIPVLRVETEHVQSASHSASIAPFHEEIFFFMESRGISRINSKSLLRDGILGKNTEEERETGE